jgi:hypothetical protein
MDYGHHGGIPKAWRDFRQVYGMKFARAELADVFVGFRVLSDQRRSTSIDRCIEPFVKNWHTPRPYMDHADAWRIEPCPTWGSPPNSNP